MALAALLLALGPPSYVQAQGNLHRLAANFHRFDGTENFTTNTPLPNAQGGLLIYTKGVTIPASDNTLFVTVSGTADVHGGGALLISCAIQTNACNPGVGANGAPSGWVLVQRNVNDEHDNSFYASWCAVTAPGTRNVRVRMASLDGSEVFTEQVHIYIDSANLTATARQCAFDNAAPSPTVPQ